MENQELINTTDTMQNPEQQEKRKSLLVKSKYLLYMIADKGYLELLNQVKKDKYHPNRKVWFFDYNEKLEKIINKYIADRKAQAAEGDSNK